MNKLPFKNDWKILTSFLPDDWETQAEELGALKRKRNFDSADSLLRVLLIHLADGKSLRSTVAYAKQAGICEVSDTALLYRLKESGKWLRKMAEGVMQKMPLKVDDFSSKYQMRIVDGSVISEPGSTGSDWRIHYSFSLDNLRCDNFNITSVKKGETLKMYKINQKDIILGDRGYCNRNGIMHVLDKGGNVILRFHSTNLPLFTRKNEKVALLRRLKRLKDNEIKDCDVWFKSPKDNQLVKGRICAIRKSKEAIEKAKKKIFRSASKRGGSVRKETLEYAEYVIIFTTLNRHIFKSKKILSLYRGRWQIELVFKRLKSILKIGHLPKHDEDSCIAWLYGKMLVALLTERLHQEAEFFSPWGFPLSIAFNRQL